MIRKIYQKFMEISTKVVKDHTGAYAAQAAFFFVLCMIPIILLLLTLVQYTPVTKADVMTAVVQVFPKSINPLIVSIVNQVYNQSRAIIPVTALVALWSAGKGVLAMTYGLNSVYESSETRNYFFIRIRATIYTVFFILVILFLLILSVFGNSISLFVESHAPFLAHITRLLIEIRTVLTMIILTVFFTFIYRFLPNRKSTFRKQLTGAVFTAVGWLAASFIFSVYVDVFQGFSDMYGSLTTIVLIMLWLYVCMYILLLGGELNVMLEDYIRNRKAGLKRRN